MRRGKGLHPPLWLLVSLSIIYSADLFSLTPGTPPNKDHARIKPNGTFIWVDSRRASYVAAPISSMSDLHGNEPKIISFGNVLRWHDGTVCSRWELRPNHIYCAFLEDPLLTDTQLLPRQEGHPNHLLNQGYEVLCEGIPIGSLTDIDGRTLIVPMSNSTVNSLFEKPIDPEVRQEMARVLKQRNFITLGPEKITQDDFRKAISFYVSQIGGFNIRFYRSPITWRVMDGLVESPELRKRIGLDVP